MLKDHQSRNILIFEGYVELKAKVRVVGFAESNVCQVRM